MDKHVDVLNQLGGHGLTADKIHPASWKHKANHITLSVDKEPNRKVKAVRMDYASQGSALVCWGKGKTGNNDHDPHDPIAVWITEQESVIWESETEPFVVFLMAEDANGTKRIWSEDTPFYRPFPANSIEGTYYDEATKTTKPMHRLSSGPARTEWVGRRPKFHFAVRFLGQNWDAEELDPHMTTMP